MNNTNNRNLSYIPLAAPFLLAMALFFSFLAPGISSAEPSTLNAPSIPRSTLNIPEGSQLSGIIDPCREFKSKEDCEFLERITKKFIKFQTVKLPKFERIINQFPDSLAKEKQELLQRIAAIQHAIREAQVFMKPLSPDTLTSEQKQAVKQKKRAIKQDILAVKAEMMALAPAVNQTKQATVKLFLDADAKKASPYISFRISNTPSLSQLSDTVAITLTPAPNTLYKNQLQVCDASTKTCSETISFTCLVPSSSANFCQGTQTIVFPLPVHSKGVFLKATIRSLTPASRQGATILNQLVRYAEIQITSDVVSTSLSPQSSRGDLSFLGSNPISGQNPFVNTATKITAPANLLLTHTGASAAPSSAAPSLWWTYNYVTGEHANGSTQDQWFKDRFPTITKIDRGVSFTYDPSGNEASEFALLFDDDRWAVYGMQRGIKAWGTISDREFQEAFPGITRVDQAVAFDANNRGGNEGVVLFQGNKWWVFYFDQNVGYHGKLSDPDMQALFPGLTRVDHTASAEVFQGGGDEGLLLFQDDPDNTQRWWVCYFLNPVQCYNGMVYDPTGQGRDAAFQHAFPGIKRVSHAGSYDGNNKDGNDIWYVIQDGTEFWTYDMTKEPERARGHGTVDDLRRFGYPDLAHILNAVSYDTNNQGESETLMIIGEKVTQAKNDAQFIRQEGIPSTMAPRI